MVDGFSPQPTVPITQTLLQLESIWRNIGKRKTESGEATSCLGLSEASLRDGSFWNYYGTNRLGRVLHRPSEPAGIIGEVPRSFTA